MTLFQWVEHDVARSAVGEALGNKSLAMQDDRH